MAVIHYEPPSGSAALSAAFAIRCTNLVKHYGTEVRAVDGLDLAVHPGECFGLLGPNGAGKTTTVEILEGLLAPTSGEVEILGQHWSDNPVALRARLGITLQQTNLPDRLSVTEILTLFRSFYRRGPEVAEVIARVALQEKSTARFTTLSGGQKQRLAIACALVGDPELLFLDEPTTGLDPQSRRQLWDVLADLKKQGRTVLLTTHYMDEAEQLCDRVAIIDHGKVIRAGTPRELISGIVGREVVEFSSADSGQLTPELLRALPDVQAVRRDRDGWSLTVDRFHIAIPALLALLEERQIPLDRLATHSATLEDVFVTLTGRHLRD